MRAREIIQADNQIKVVKVWSEQGNTRKILWMVHDSHM